MLAMKKFFNDFIKFKGNFNFFSFWTFFLGVFIFGIWLTIMTNFSDKIRIIIEYDNDYDPMCIGMSGWKIPLEDCYWNYQDK